MESVNLIVADGLLRINNTTHAPFAVIGKL